VHSLREKVSELEKEYSLISEAVVSATAGKEEALTSALAEITNLKEEILSKTYVLSLYCIVTFTASLVKWNLHFLHSVLKFQRWKFRYLD
jgi:hypothetical protein